MKKEEMFSEEDDEFFRDEEIEDKIDELELD